MEKGWSDNQVIDQVNGLIISCEAESQKLKGPPQKIRNRKWSLGLSVQTCILKHVVKTGYCISLDWNYGPLYVMSLYSASNVFGLRIDLWFQRAYNWNATQGGNKEWKKGDEGRGKGRKYIAFIYILRLS